MGAVEVMVGIALPAVLGRHRRERAAGLGLLVPLALLGLLAYGLIDRLFVLR